MGIEPTTAAWEAAVLPLNYIRIIRGRFAPEGGTRRCNDYFTTNAQKVNRFSENCREETSRGTDRARLHPTSPVPCQQEGAGSIRTKIVRQPMFRSANGDGAALSWQACQSHPRPPVGRG